MSTRDVVTAYIRAIEAHDLDGVARLLHPDVELVEHPNKLNPRGARYDKAAMRAAGERGKAAAPDQRYEIRAMLVDGERAAVQIAWSARLPNGAEMTAHICSVVELRDGLVWRQEQYDCFT